MTIKQFKDEFRLVCSDTWGDAMEAWFECAGRLHTRGLKVPPEWEYRPARTSSGQCSKDSYWFDLFKRCSTRQLRAIGNLLFRYCQLLKHFGKSY